MKTNYIALALVFLGASLTLGAALLFDLHPVTKSGMPYTATVLGCLGVFSLVIGALKSSE